MFSLSWIVQGDKAIVTLDLLNSTKVPLLLRQLIRGRDDVSTSFAKAQTANAQAEGFGEPGQMEKSCPLTAMAWSSRVLDRVKSMYTGSVLFVRPVSISYSSSS